MVMLTSLVGARSSSIRPTGGSRPLQLQNRMRMKNAANSGMYGRAAGAGDADAEVAQELVERTRTAFWRAARDELRARGSSGWPPTSTIAMTIHIVRIVELMLG